MGCQILVVLRSDVLLESDVALAAREISALARAPCEPVADVSSALEECLEAPGVSLAELLGRPLTLRPNGCQGFFVRDPDTMAFDRILRRSAFAQEVFASSGQARGVPALSIAWATGQLGFALFALLETLDGLMPWLRRQADQGYAIDAARDYLLKGVLPHGLSSDLARKALMRRGTLHLTHDLHVYKAKFFPRMVGALLNLYGPEAEGVLLEPFSGSGTALFEAALRGISSVGFDIDPVSAMISAAKVTPLAASPKHFDELAGAVLAAMDAESFGSGARAARLPQEIRARLLAKDAREKTAYVHEIERDATAIRSAIAPFTGPDRLLLDTLFSDALTKKVRYRFVGVGNGRYTFAVTKEPIQTRFRKKLLDLASIATVLHWVAANVQPIASSSAGVADACELPLAEDYADIAITSPPYLPASSGREHYALARAIPLALVGVGTPEQLHALSEKALGAVAQCDCPPDQVMHAAMDHGSDCVLAEPSSVDESELPAHATELLRFLAADPQRRLKHRPTLEYLDAISRSARECLRVLKPGGRLLMVLSKQSVFYESRTRETLFVCNTAELVAEIAASAGFEVEDAIDMELLKQGTPNARPRALDAYFERILVLRAPAETQRERDPRDVRSLLATA
jgi:tRNA G10  N-methylase Trm11